MLRGIVTFFVSLILLFLVAGLLGANVGPYEELLAVVIALVITWVVVRARRHPT